MSEETQDHPVRTEEDLPRSVMASRLPQQASQFANSIKETSSTPGINKNETSQNNVSM